MVAGWGGAARAKAKQRMDAMVVGGETKKGQKGQEKEKGKGKGKGAGQKPPAQGRDLLQGGKGKGQGKGLGKGQGSSSGPTGLMEVDLFEDVRPKNARGGAGGAVRLLVCRSPDA